MAITQDAQEMPQKGGHGNTLRKDIQVEGAAHGEALEQEQADPSDEQEVSAVPCEELEGQWAGTASSSSVLPWGDGQWGLEQERNTI